MHIIKRYQNRKLYDTYSKKYITLDKIAEYVQRGEDIEILDNETGKDLTAQTLIQIIFTNKNLYGHYLPTSFLMGLIRMGEKHFRHLHEEAPSLPGVGADFDNFALYIEEFLVFSEPTYSGDTTNNRTVHQGSPQDESELTIQLLDPLLKLLVESYIPSKEDINHIINQLDIIEEQIESITDTTQL